MFASGRTFLLSRLKGWQTSVKVHASVGASCPTCHRAPAHREEQHLAAVVCSPASNHSSLEICWELERMLPVFWVLNHRSPTALSYMNVQSRGAFPSCVALMDGVTGADNELGDLQKKAWKAFKYQLFQSCFAAVERAIPASPHMREYFRIQSYYLVNLRGNHENKLFFLVPARMNVLVLIQIHFLTASVFL